MNLLVPIIADRIPALIVEGGEHAAFRFAEFFTARIRNSHTRRAYGRAVSEFCAWLETHGVPSIVAVSSLHVAAYVETLGREQIGLDGKLSRLSPASVKLRLAAIRMMFDHLATGGILPFNPASAVRGPRHVVQRGKTPVLDPAEARQLIDAIDVSTMIGLRDRALIGLMVYSFARIGAALAMKIEDVYVQNRRLWVRLHEKGGKHHAMPCHHNLETYLHAYIEGCAIADDSKGPLFRTIARGTRQLSTRPLRQAEAYALIRRRAAAAKIKTKIGNHTFRATGITAYLKNGGTLEKAAVMASHASTRTTQLYDRRSDEVNLDEVEKVMI
jgi:integrase/recombinase XerD